MRTPKALPIVAAFIGGGVLSASLVLTSTGDDAPSLASGPSPAALAAADAPVATEAPVTGPSDNPTHTVVIPGTGSTLPTAVPGDVTVTAKPRPTYSPMPSPPAPESATPVEPEVPAAVDGEGEGETPTADPAIICGPVQPVSEPLPTEAETVPAAE